MKGSHLFGCFFCGEIKFVRDTAIERRSLTPAQRMHIVLSTEDLVNGIYEEGKKNKREAMKKAHENNPNHKSDSLASAETKLPNPPHNSSKKLAEIAGVSRAQMVV